MLLALLPLVAPALLARPHDTSAAEVPSDQEEQRREADPFVPFDFGPEPLPAGPIRMDAPRHIPGPVAERMAELWDADLATLRETYGREADRIEFDPPTVRRAEVGGGLELWILSTAPVAEQLGREHRHFLHDRATARVGATATWGAHHFRLTDEELAHDPDATPAPAGPRRPPGLTAPTLLRRTDLDADGTPELALHSVEHNGTMWHASALLVLDVADDLSLHHAVKLYTEVYEVPTGAQLFTRWEAAPGGPIVHWSRHCDDPLLAGPIGAQWLGREGPGQRFRLLRHETDDPRSGFLLESVEHEPAGGFAGGR